MNIPKQSRCSNAMARRKKQKEHGGRPVQTMLHKAIKLVGDDNRGVDEDAFSIAVS